MSGRGWLATAVAVGAMLAVPAASGAQAPAQDSVSGSGVAGFWGQFQIDIRSGPSGESPIGQASFQPPPGVSSGSVSCLAVRDNVATFIISGTQFGLMIFEVTDNAGLNARDVITGFPTSRSPDNCSPLAVTETSISGEVLTGDVVVVDAPPLPTSKEQCKVGGWRSFGVFKNQGQCVSFVTTGGNSPPAA